MYYDKGFIDELYKKELEEYILWVVALKEKFDGEPLSVYNCRYFFENFSPEMLYQVEKRNIRIGGMHYVLGVDDITLEMFLCEIEKRHGIVSCTFHAFLDHGTVVHSNTGASPEAIALSEALE